MVIILKVRKLSVLRVVDSNHLGLAETKPSAICQPISPWLPLNLRPSNTTSVDPGRLSWRRICDCSASIRSERKSVRSCWGWCFPCGLPVFHCRNIPAGRDRPPAKHWHHVFSKEQKIVSSISNVDTTKRHVTLQKG